MSVFTSQATPSHRYYMRKTKREIVDRIHDLSGALLDAKLPVPELALAHKETLMGKTKERLARLAMLCHNTFPKEPPKTPAFKWWSSVYYRDEDMGVYEYLIVCQPKNGDKVTAAIRYNMLTMDKDYFISAVHLRVGLMMRKLGIDDD